MITPFSIVAEFSLGTFRGASEDGRLDPLPSVSRLYSALLCAAGFGARAVAVGGVTQPSLADRTALVWVEEHLPDAVSIPPLRSNLGNAVAHRDTGTLLSSKVRRSSKAPDASVAVGGSFVWTWTSPPPDEVADALDALCGDVPYLGTTESPVRLRTTRDPHDATHTLDLDADLFGGGGADVEVPLESRLEELGAAHALNHGSPPSPRTDRVKSRESETTTTPPRNRVAIARYAPVSGAKAEVPWPQVLLLPINFLPEVNRRVRWAVALHRALIATIGDGAPPLLTGAYPRGAPRPANRVALQVIDGALLPEITAKAALAVMIPAGAEAADVAAVAAAAATIKHFQGSGRRYPTTVGRPALVAGDAFWAPPPPGTVRAWRTSPATVPDDRGWGDRWSFADALALSFGYVWQGTSMITSVTGGGEARARALAGQARARLGSVLAITPLRTNRPHDYVHRVHEHAVVRPYRAELMTGELGTDRTLQAVGQGRHLGGGLLVPVDVVIDDAEVADAHA